MNEERLKNFQPATPAEKLLEAALGEFVRDGTVTTVRCHVCNELIQITPIGDTALRVSCPCSHFNGTLRL